MSSETTPLRVGDRVVFVGYDPSANSPTAGELSGWPADVIGFEADLRGGYLSGYAVAVQFFHGRDVRRAVDFTDSCSIANRLVRLETWAAFREQRLEEKQAAQAAAEAEERKRLDARIEQQRIDAEATRRAADEEHARRERRNLENRDFRPPERAGAYSGTNRSW